jgi:hypothetical protein
MGEGQVGSMRVVEEVELVMFEVEPLSTVE